MDPVQRAWNWWTDVVEFPFWDPWLAGLALFVAFVLVVYFISKMLRP